MKAIFIFISPGRSSDLPVEPTAKHQGQDHNYNDVHNDAPPNQKAANLSFPALVTVTGTQNRLTALCLETKMRS